LNKLKLLLGRDLLVNRARAIAYPGQISGLIGQDETGKSLFLRYIYDLEKSRGRNVAWFECFRNCNIPDLLESLRYQLGVRIQPGKDKNDILTNMKSSVTICIDNAEHLETLSWIGDIKSKISFVLSVNETFGNRYIFDKRVKNWLQIPHLNPIEKKQILNSYLGFVAPPEFHSKVQFAQDSKYPRYLKLLSVGIKRFRHRSTKISVT
jgi:hypothetical protein